MPLFHVLAVHHVEDARGRWEQITEDLRNTVQDLHAAQDEFVTLREEPGKQGVSRPIGQQRLRDQEPIWSPDGSRLAVVSGNISWVWDANLAPSAIWIVPRARNIRTNMPTTESTTAEPLSSSVRRSAANAAAHVAEGARNDRYQSVARHAPDSDNQRRGHQDDQDPSRYVAGFVRSA